MGMERLAATQQLEPSNGKQKRGPQGDAPRPGKTRPAGRAGHRAKRQIAAPERPHYSRSRRGYSGPGKRL
ncbi:hypothetical protein AZSI13_31620 [Azospira sp. I13]|nr:hypothetical protein AZSI13_31620 [Azospira sp. I13]